MAGTAVIQDTRVIHRRVRKVVELGRRVTQFACRSRRQVIRWLRHRCHTEENLSVMARVAPAGDACMVHQARPRSRTVRMTQRTSLRHRKVVQRQGYCRAYERGRRKVTYLAVIRSGDMRRWRILFSLGWHSSRKSQTVAVATGTCAGRHYRVIHAGR